MRARRIFGVVLLVVGVAALMFANYIESQVNMGKKKVAKAEKKVDQAKGLFSLSPATKEIGGKVTEQAQEKIDEGKQTISQYENLAGAIQIGGIICVVLGGGILLFSFLGKSRSRK